MIGGGPGRWLMCLQLLFSLNRQQVCPAYTFGESYTYRNLVNAALIPAVVKAKLNAWGVPTVLPCGAWWCPPLPMGRRGLHTVVSSGRQFPRFAQPTAEQVDEYHQVCVYIRPTPSESSSQGSTLRVSGLQAGAGTERCMRVYERRQKKKQQTTVCSDTFLRPSCITRGRTRAK